MNKNVKQPLISVVLPVYNGEKYLDAAITSVLAQTFTNFELLIINDGSQDSSEHIVNRYDDQRIRLINNPKNIGLVATLNKGIQQASGQYIARIDSDDVCYPTRFEEQISCFKEDKSLGVVGSSAHIIDGNGDYSGLYKVPEHHADIKLGLLFTSQIIHPSAMIKKSVIDELLPEVFDARQLHIEDYALWVTLIDKTNFYNIQTPLIQYRVHGENISVVNAHHQSVKSLELKKKLCTSFDINPSMESIFKVQNDLKLSSASREDIIERLFDRLTPEFYESWFISRLFWECNIKLKLNGKGDIFNYLQSPYRKKLLWIALYILTPVISKLPNSLFEKRFRIFQR